MKKFRLAKNYFNIQIGFNYISVKNFTQLLKFDVILPTARKSLYELITNASSAFDNSTSTFDIRKRDPDKDILHPNK